MSQTHGKSHLTRLQKAYHISATVVALYGEKYLPVFIRLHEELEKCSRLETAHFLALKVAQHKIGIQTGIQNSTQANDTKE